MIRAGEQSTLVQSDLPQFIQNRLDRRRRRPDDESFVIGHDLRLLDFRWRRTFYVIMPRHGQETVGIVEHDSYPMKVVDRSNYRTFGEVVHAPDCIMDETP